MTLVQELWPSLTGTLSQNSAMKPRDLGLLLEPPGRKSLPPSLGRRQVPTGSPTPRHPRVGEQFGHALGEAGQVGRGWAEVFGVPGGSVNRKAVLECPGQGTGEFLYFPVSLEEFRNFRL